MIDPTFNKLGFDEITLERLLNFLPYPFLLSESVDATERTIFLNKKFVQEIGYTAEEIPTIKEWFKFAYPEPDYQKTVVNEWETKSAQAMRIGRDSIVMKARIYTKHRKEKWYEVKASIEGKFHLVAFINIDKEIRREEELERQNENKNQTLSVLTHDIRGPLNNLLGILRLSGQGLITQEQYTRSLNLLSSNVFKLIEFLDTTLQWTRANFAQVNTSFEPVDLHKILMEILQVYENQYQEKKITVSVDVDGIKKIRTDPEIVSIVSRNIISNAIKFTQENGNITITGKKIGNRTTVAFTDTGMGMSPERIGMIVNKKYTSEKGTSGEKGLGMGLQLCNQLLFKIGGKLEIESVINNGTTVTMVL
jgi:signal transduction histidine kinase